MRYSFDVGRSNLFQSCCLKHTHLQLLEEDGGNQTLAQLAALSGRKSALDAVWHACRKLGITAIEVPTGFSSRRDRLLLLTCDSMVQMFWLAWLAQSFQMGSRQSKVSVWWNNGADRGG